MLWEVRVTNARGQAKVLETYQNRETALRHVDALYSKYGYPMHLAYKVYPASESDVPFLPSFQSAYAG